MSKHRVAVLKVVTNQSSVTAAAAEYGLSRGYLQRLLRRYREGGLEALEPRSRRPHSSPGRTPAAVRDRIVTLRTKLTAQGLDAGPVTIAWHLEREGLRAPSTSTVRRILHGAGLVTPEPRKRPRSSWRSFQAAAPERAVAIRAIGRITPAEAYRARPKAHPAGRGAPGHLRLRYDVTDKKGTITLRRAGRLHHLGIGAAHARRRVLAIVDERAVTVVDLETGEVLSAHRIEPDRGYWRNQRRDPGRWPGPRATR